MSMRALFHLLGVAVPDRVCADLYVLATLHIYSIAGGQQIVL